MPDRRLRTDLHLARWIGGVVAIIGIAASAAADLHPVAERSLLEQGALAVALGYQRALPLMGVGCVLALSRFGAAAPGALAAILGVCLGLAARDWLVATIFSGPATASRLALPGPISCLAAGLMLGAAERLRSWLLLPAAVVIGAMLAIGIEIVDPSFHDPNFLRGALAASIWLIAAAACAARLCDRPWLRIGIRIFGSWLIAIGLLLGAATLLPRARVEEPSLPPPESPAFRGQDQRPPAGDRSPSPFAPPRFDPLRQP